MPWSIRALEAGKHVLCEKPIGLSAAEGQKLVDAARRVPAAEGDGSLHVPPPSAVATGQADSCTKGASASCAPIQSFFSYYNVDPRNIRNQAEIGGGGLIDIGCYCISLSRFLFDAEPRRVLGIVEYDPKFRTDRLASGILEFGEGHVHLHVRHATRRPISE